MDPENLLLSSIFTIFLGVMVFLASILNKINVFFKLMDQYFVLFLFLGICISSLGIILALIWKFENRTPFYDNKPKKRSHFAQFLIGGAVFVLVAFTSIFHFQGLSRLGFILTISASITGILLMLIGLKYYISEVMQKTAGHS